jgi:hypothetical protein
MRLHYPSGAEGKLLYRSRWDKELIGVKDGFNTSFQTPQNFVQVDEIVIRVYRNGQRLSLGASKDYTVSESGGVGTGYDTVTFNGSPPLDYEILTADYIEDI